MPDNPLEKSIKSAVKMNASLGKFFAEAGDISTGKGYVVRAYRNANRALPAALQESDPRLAVRDIMHDLRRTIETETRSSFEDSFSAGREEAARQLRFYGIGTDPEGSAEPVNLSRQVNAAVDAVVSQVDRQETTLSAMMVSEVDQALILGDEERQGVLKPSDILVGAAYWIGALVWDGYSNWVERNQTVTFQKQAIAALDSRTTDCCLRVHGQVVGLQGRFHLTGTPRFADDLDWSPFHWYCRTSVALYLPEFDEGLTARMRQGANHVLNERKQGRTPDQHPADAFWN